MLPALLGFIEGYLMPTGSSMLHDVDDESPECDVIATVVTQFVTLAKPHQDSLPTVTTTFFSHWIESIPFLESFIGH